MKRFTISNTTKEECVRNGTNYARDRQKFVVVNTGVFREFPLSGGRA